jgi:hypothetical protein
VKPLIGTGYLQPKIANGLLLAQVSKANTNHHHEKTSTQTLSQQHTGMSSSLSYRSGKQHTSTAPLSTEPPPIVPPSINRGAYQAWYVPYVTNSKIPILNPNNATIPKWELGVWGNAVLEHLPLRPHHTVNGTQAPSYQLPDLYDPFRELISGVTKVDEQGREFFSPPNPNWQQEFLLKVVPIAVKESVIELGELGNLTNLSRIALGGKKDPKTNLPYTQAEKDAALTEWIRTIAKKSVGIAKFMQIVSNNASARNRMPEATYQALRSCQSDLPPSWQPEEVVRLAEEQFKQGDYLKTIANRPENSRLKDVLLREGKVVVELLKNKQGNIEPLGVASTAEVYRCKISVVNKNNNQELLSHAQVVGDDTGRIIKVLKKNLVVPQWWDKWVKLEDLPKKQLERDRHLLIQLFSLICDDQRVLDYWLGKVETLCDSWKQELDLRNGAENGRMLAEAAIARDKNGVALHNDAAGNPYPVFDVALSDFSTYCMDVQAEAKGISVKKLEEIKEYTRNIVSEGLFAYLETHPTATLRSIMDSPQAQKEIALAGLQCFEAIASNPKETTSTLALKLDQLWQQAPTAKRPKATSIDSAIALSNHLEVALHQLLESVNLNIHTNPPVETAPLEPLQAMVNTILAKELQETHQQVLLKTIGLIQQYSWLVTDPNLMAQVGESFAHASLMQMTQTTLRPGETEAKMRLHMDVTKANVFVYRDDAWLETTQTGTANWNPRGTSQGFMNKMQEILFDPTVINKAEKLQQLLLEKEINPYRIQYIDTGGVGSIDIDQFLNDLQLVVGFCTGNPHQLQTYYKKQIAFKPTLSVAEKQRLQTTHQLSSLVKEQKISDLLTVFVAELYSQPVEDFLNNNLTQATQLEDELRQLLQTKNPLEAFYQKLRDERIALFNTELPHLFNSQIFEIKDNVQSFDLAWNLVQSELIKRRIPHDLPHYDILKAKLLQVTTGFSLLEQAGGDHNDLLMKSLLSVFTKAYDLNPQAFEALKNETLTHVFVEKPQQSGKMMALFLPEQVAKTIAGMAKKFNTFKQVLPVLLAGLGATTVAGVGILKYNSIEQDNKKREATKREEKAFLA